jgi:4-amino-4-deoxy-L-arabinose transferase-like glycosyltransferase
VLALPSAAKSLESTGVALLSLATNSRVAATRPESVLHSLERIFFVLAALFSLWMLVFPLTLPLELWDESRYANSAVEMSMRGHWLTPTYNWHVDHWSPKPPLLIWSIALLERAHLPPMLALRLPSELAGLATVAVVYLFCRFVLGRRFVALAAAMILMSSTLFFGTHIAMSGDCDALLSLFTTICTVAFFYFAENPGPRTTTALTLAALALLSAIMVKGVAGTFILPGLLTYAVLRGQLRRLGTDRRFWLAIGGVTFVVALYYVGRNHIDPGYLQSVWINELGGRYLQTLEAHKTSPFIYLSYLFAPASPGMLFGLLAVFALRRTRQTATQGEQIGTKNRSQAAAVCCLTTALVLLAIISASQTRLLYYCAPAIPLLSIAAAIGCGNLLELSAARFSGASVLPYLQAVVFVLLLCWLSRGMFLSVKGHGWNQSGEQVQYGLALGDLKDTKEQLSDQTPVLLIDHGFFDFGAADRDYDPVADYYAKEATRAGMKTAREPTMPQQAANVWLLSCDPEITRSLQAAYPMTPWKQSHVSCLYGPATQQKNQLMPLNLP